MAEIEVKLSGQDINQAVADAIIKSALGDSIAKGVAQFIKNNLSQSYNNPIDKVIEEVVRNKIIELVNKEYKTQIENTVQIKIAGEAGQRIVNIAVEKFIKAIY